MSAKAGMKCSLKRDACVALRFIQHQVRERASDEIEITEEGDKLTLHNGAESPPYFQEQDDNLVYSNGTTTSVVVKGGVASLNFELIEGHTPGDYLLSVNLQLTRDSLSTEAQSLISLRN